MDVRWIKSSDQLPEIGELVIVYTGRKTTLGNRYLRNGWSWHFDNRSYPQNAITHWMPLPLVKE